MKLFVIGDEDAVLGFRLVGVDGLATTDAAVAADKLAHLVSDRSVGIVIVTAGIAGALRAQLDELEQTATMPIVLEIPAPGEALGRPALRQVVRRALGAGA